jgi:DNA-binding CsgD family transcriptional regulator
MAITSIPALLPATSDAVANDSANVPAVQAVQPAANASSDTVQLTVAERVYQLYNQGQQISQIATALSLSVAAVNNYLNISNSST